VCIIGPAARLGGGRIECVASTHGRDRYYRIFGSSRRQRAFVFSFVCTPVRASCDYRASEIRATGLMPGGACGRLSAQIQQCKMRPAGAQRSMLRGFTTSYCPWHCGRGRSCVQVGRRSCGCPWLSRGAGGPDRAVGACAVRFVREDDEPLRKVVSSCRQPSRVARRLDDLRSFPQTAGKSAAFPQPSTPPFLHRGSGA
jgi:hypothetical protein